MATTTNRRLTESANRATQPKGSNASGHTNCRKPDPGSMAMFVPGGKKPARGPGRDESDGIRSECTGGHASSHFPTCRRLHEELRPVYGLNCFQGAFHLSWKCDMERILVICFNNLGFPNIRPCWCHLSSASERTNNRSKHSTHVALKTSTPNPNQIQPKSTDQQPPTLC